MEQREVEKFNEEYGHYDWYLHVKILFLKYCKASLKKSRYKELLKDPYASHTEIMKAFGEEIMNLEYILPRFRCDYRTSVFLTLYSPDGRELDTIKQIPIAPKNKTEITSGETIWVTFVRPILDDYGEFGKPVSWQVWMPK